MPRNRKAPKRPVPKAKAKSKRAVPSALPAAPPRAPRKRAIAQYDHHAAERVNNPPVGLVTPETDNDTRKKTYEYDPHLDPQLQWAGMWRAF